MADYTAGPDIGCSGTQASCVLAGSMPSLAASKHVIVASHTGDGAD